MARLKAADVEEIRIVDRQLEDGRFESTAYIKARGEWYKDTRYPAGEDRDGKYDRAAIISEFIAFQDIYDKCEDPGGEPPNPRHRR